MKNLEHYLSYLKLILSQGVQSDDARFSDEALTFLLLNIRTDLISNKHKKYNFISDQTYQTIPCIVLSLSTLDDCDCLPSDIGCKYRRSDIEIPTIVTGRNGYLANLTDMYGNKIDIKSFTENKYDKYSLTKSNKPSAFIRNNKLYITNNIELERVSLNAVFYDPTELSEISCGTDTEEVCYDIYTEPFPMEKDLSDILFKMSFEDIIKYSMRMPQDVTNNATSPK